MAVSSWSKIERKNLSMINFQLILQQSRLRGLRFGERYKSKRTLRCSSTTVNSPNEDKEIYVPRKPIPSPVHF